jgi:hypothetical protein
LESKYLIYWRSKATGAEGHGVTPYLKETAEHIALEANKEFPEIFHWIIPVQQPKEQEENAEE